MLAGSIFYNVFQGVELFGYKEFILIAFLIFLVIGDEFSSFTVRKDGVEIKNKVNNTK